MIFLTESRNKATATFRVVSKTDGDPSFEVRKQGLFSAPCAPAGEGTECGNRARRSQAQAAARAAGSEELRGAVDDAGVLAHCGVFCRICLRWGKISKRTGHDGRPFHFRTGPRVVIRSSERLLVVAAPAEAAGGRLAPRRRRPRSSGGSDPSRDFAVLPPPPTQRARTGSGKHSAVRGRGGPARTSASREWVFGRTRKCRMRGLQRGALRGVGMTRSGSTIQLKRAGACSCFAGIFWRALPASAWQGPQDGAA